MKKLIFIFAIFILASCAGRQTTNYVIPDQIKERPYQLNFIFIVEYLKLFNDEECPRLYIHPSAESNAWVDENNGVHLTDKIFIFDDDTITFVMAHELSHAKLNHISHKRVVSYATTGLFFIAGAFIPGAGLLNWVVNPAVTNNYSKTQEYEADKLASEVLTNCFKMPIERQIQIIQAMQTMTKDGGGFWDQHPSWADRMKNIKNTP